MKGPHPESSPLRNRASPLARVLVVVVLALILAAMGAALLAGLTAFLIFFVVLIPVLLLLVAVALTGRGTVNIRVRSVPREPGAKQDGNVAKLKNDS